MGLLTPYMRKIPANAVITPEMVERLTPQESSPQEIVSIFSPLHVPGDEYQSPINHLLHGD